MILAGSAAAQGTPPPFPQAFYGDATIRSQPAPVGTVVEARGVNVKLDINKPDHDHGRRQVRRADIGRGQAGRARLALNGTPVYFYLNGERAEVSRDGVTWPDSIPFQSGVVSKVHLRMLWRVYYLPIWI